MTAIGINCSDREPITIFNNKPRYMSQAEHDYRDAADNAERRWKFYSLMVDEWAGDYDALEELLDECQALDHLKSMLYKQWQCQHQGGSHIEGRQDFVGGAYFDNTREICDECGGKVSFHTSILPVNIIDIP